MPQCVAADYNWFRDCIGPRRLYTIHESIKQTTGRWPLVMSVIITELVPSISFNSCVTSHGFVLRAVTHCDVTVFERDTLRPVTDDDAMVNW